MREFQADPSILKSGMCNIDQTSPLMAEYRQGEGDDLRKLLSSVLWPIPALLFAPMIVLFAVGVRVKKKERESTPDNSV